MSLFSSFARTIRDAIYPSGLMNNFHLKWNAGNSFFSSISQLVPLICSVLLFLLSFDFTVLCLRFSVSVGGDQNRTSVCLCACWLYGWGKHNLYQYATQHAKELL